jgi:hypothetical protein
MVLVDTLNLYLCGSFTDTLDFSPNTALESFDPKDYMMGLFKK